MIVSFWKRGPGSEEERECGSVEGTHLNIPTPRRARGSVAVEALKLNLA